MDRLTRRLLVAWCAIGVAGLAAYPLLGTVMGAVVYQAFSVGAAALMVVGARLHRARRPVAWWLLATGIGLWSAGDLLWTIDELVREIVVPFPSVADVGYLTGYVFLGAGLHQLTSDGAEGDESTLDALTLTVGLALAIWVPIFEPLATSSYESASGAVISLAYPVGSLLLSAMVMRAVLRGPRRPVALVLLGLAGALSLVADSVFAWMSNEGTYTSGHPIDLLWIGGYVAFGAAALHPSMVAIGQADRRTEARPAGRVRHALLWAVVIEVPLVQWWAAASDSPSQLLIVAVSAAAVALVMLRMSRLMRRVSFAASSDRLTGLPNRRTTERALEEALARSPRTAVLFLDVDRFKHVNDNYGHRAGDRFLLSVADRLVAAVPPGAVLGRFGGDEFVVVCEGLDGDGLVRLAERLVDAFREPFLVGGAPLHASASVGVATAADGDDAEVLLANADAAMYAAKGAGRGRWQLFNRAMRDGLAARTALEHELRTALDTGELVVHYQPVMDLTTARVAGVEALVRWRHPTRGLLLPRHFISIAEETGLVVPLGRQVLREATLAMAQLPAHLTLAVNVSGHQFEGNGLVGDVIEARAVSGLLPDRLILEITETVLLEAGPAVLQQMEELREVGVRFAIDDFGTGFSSFSRLRDLPASLLKIDRAFVTGLGGGGKQDTIVAGLTYLAHGLGLEVVAEGVETAQEHERVRRLGCDTGQGFRWSEAVPAEELPALIRSVPAPVG